MQLPGWTDPLRPDLDRHRIGRSIFLRGMGLIYLVAILSWAVQVAVLVGEDGLVPAADFLSRLRENADQLDRPPWLALPSLFWISGASDFAFHLTCLAGVIFSLLVIAGRLTGPALVLLWILYLSLVQTGSVFMSYQWDMLLLEAGFLAPFLSPWTFRCPWRDPPPLSIVNRVALVFLWLLVAKLMFFSGWVKLAWAGDAHPEWWPDRSALDFHYWTQPLPTWTAWHAHHAPAWFHTLSIWIMYGIELFLPFAILFGRHGRLAAAIGFSFLMLMILALGNYTYFNWLTILLCIPLVQDRLWPKFFREALDFAPLGVPARLPRAALVRQWVIAGALIVGLGTLQVQVILRDLHRAPNPVFAEDPTPEWLDAYASHLNPFRIASGYGLFRTMTTSRPEIIVEGSRDGEKWVEYDFSWKVDDVSDRPDFVAPHQPRVAWQFWFAALEGRYHPRSRNAGWIQGLVFGLLRGDSEVESLLKQNPFPEEPPTHVRARLYEYEFTTPEERAETGNWWKRSLEGSYLPPVTLGPGQ